MLALGPENIPVNTLHDNLQFIVLEHLQKVYII